MLKSGEKMRKFLKAYLVPILIIIFVLFNIFVLNTHKYSQWIPSLIWIGIVVLAFKIYGNRGRTPDKYIDIMQLLFIYCMGYELITYLSGLFLGFVRSPYSMQPITMIKNIAPVLVVIASQEIVRFLAISRYKNDKKVIIVITLSFILLEISTGIAAYNLSSAADIVKMVTILVGGSITKNILCSYLAYRADYKPSILYRGIFELIIYVVPIYPNLGDYIEAMVSMLFPVILLVSLMAVFEKKKYRQPKKSVLELIMMWVPTVSIVLFIFVLQSGIFKYRSMSIGSQSMYPEIKKGDVVVIEQYYEEEEFRSIVEGEVLAFRHNNIIIVHRVVKVTERNGKLVFKTKGDNNNSEDSYDVEQSQVVGVAKFRIPFIGQPSVWLSETING